MSDQLRTATLPQQFDRLTTPRIMWGVSLALLPSVIWGLYQYGGPAIALFVLILTLSLLSELVLSAILQRGSLADGNGVMVAVMLTATLPPGTPLFVAGSAALFATAVIKWTFGGTGAYWVNPVAGGYVFAVVSHAGFGREWVLPRILGGPSPLSASSLQLLEGAVVENPTRLADALLQVADFGSSGIDAQLTRFINNVGGQIRGIRIPPGYGDLFLGNYPGTIGGASAALLLLGTIFLFGGMIIPRRIPLFFVLAFSLVVYAFGGLPYGGALMSGDILFHLLTGSTLLGAFFVATETVSSPLTGKGMVLYAVLTGLLAGFLRVYGAGVHAVMLAILLGNMFVPLIDRFSMPRRYGVGRQR